MTFEILEYLLRATVVWAVLLAFYLIVRRQSDFRFQRVVLLGGWLFGLTIPLLPALDSGAILPVVNLPAISLTKTVTDAGEATIVAAQSWRFVDILPWLYLTGVLLFGARTLVRWRLIKRCFTGSRRSSFGGYTVVTSSRVTSPFAAFGYVFLPEGLDPDLTHSALLHETAHLRSRHHYDKFILTLAGIVLWFHPLAWVYRRLLANVHEYQADEAVVRSVPAKTYGLQLIRSALTPAFGLGLFSSPLKTRIAMITDDRQERKFRLLPLFALLLLMSGLVVACSDVTEVQLNDSALDNEQPMSSSSASGFKADLSQEEAETIENTVLQHRTDLTKMIYSEVTYPKRARNTGTTGTVRAEIGINENGEVSVESAFFVKPAIAASLYESETEIVVVGYPSKAIAGAPRPDILVKEVERTINALESLTPVKFPGAISNKFHFTVDFLFKLED